MDVFYYWKNFEADLTEGRIGWLKSNRGKLDAFKERSPDVIWAFKTPTGCKGQLQLIARLAWSDRPTIKMPDIESKSTVFYDPDHAETVRFIDTDTPEAIEIATEIMSNALPFSSFRSNFHGENGQHGIENNFVRQLTSFAGRYQVTSLLSSEP